MLAIVYRILATHLINKGGVPRNMARTGGSVSLAQTPLELIERLAALFRHIAIRQVTELSGPLTVSYLATTEFRFWPNAEVRHWRQIYVTTILHRTITNQPQITDGRFFESYTSRTLRYPPS